MILSIAPFYNSINVLITQAETTDVDNSNQKRKKLKLKTISMVWKQIFISQISSSSSLRSVLLQKGYHHASIPIANGKKIQKAKTYTVDFFHVYF